MRDFHECFREEAIVVNVRQAVRLQFTPKERRTLRMAARGPAGRWGNLAVLRQVKERFWDGYRT